MHSAHKKKKAKMLVQHLDKIHHKQTLLLFFIFFANTFTPYLSHCKIRFD